MKDDDDGDGFEGDKRRPELSEEEYLEVMMNEGIQRASEDFNNTSLESGVSPMKKLAYNVALVEMLRSSTEKVFNVVPEEVAGRYRELTNNVAEHVRDNFELAMTRTPNEEGNGD